MKHHKQKIIWLTWLLLVIAWNFGFPNAQPIWDVLVAVGLSGMSIGVGKWWR